MTMRKNEWLTVAGFWTFFGLVTGVQVWLSMIDHGHSVPRLIGFYILVWDFWLLTTGIVVHLVRTRPLIPLNVRNGLLHALVAIVAGVLHTMFWMLLLVGMRPYDRMTAPWEAMNVGVFLYWRMPLEIVLYLVVAGITHAIDNHRRAAQLESSLHEARLHALELQIQPHFLFNTLNAISALVRAEQNQNAVTMIASLSDLLRYLLDHDAQQFVALDDESQMLRRYLEIQRMRFPDRLQFTIDVDAAVRRAAIPLFILQPLAENAIRHGIAQSSQAGVVDVRAFREGANTRVDVVNSGKLVSPVVDGIGLLNTRERLRQLYGDAQHFDLRESDGRVVASITIPYAEAPCAP